MSDKRILIIGGDSKISKSLINFFEINNIDYLATSRRIRPNSSLVFLDLAQIKSFGVLDKENFTAVVLAASVCSIEECENNKENSRRINVDNTYMVASILKERLPNIRVIMLSTDMVFDGSIKAPNTDDYRNPLTEYGKQKAELEEKLLCFCENVKILRLGKVLDKNAPLFKEWVKKLRCGKKIQAFDDSIFSPIDIDCAVKAIVKIIDKNSFSNEVFHLSSGIDITYYQAALWLAKNLNVSDSLVEPVSMKRIFPHRIIPQRVALANNMELVGCSKGAGALQIFLE